MSLTFKIDPIDRDVAAILDEALSPDGQSQALAAFARGQLVDAQVQNARALGRTPPHETFVDGRRGAREESVSAAGVIAYEFTLLEELFKWIAEQLVLHAPALTGAFRNSFLFFADGREVATGQPAPDAAEYVFLSPLPYARKIERGQSIQAPDGVFEAVAALASRRFGNLARIRFGYRGSIAAPSGKVGGRVARKAARDARVPAIVITTGR